MSKLPEGWTLVPLGELGHYINGRAFKPVEWKKAGLPIIRIQNLTDASNSFNFSDQKHEEKYRVKNGDLLIAWSASLGAFIWNRGDAWLNQHIFRVEPNEGIVTKEFLYHAVTHAIEDLYDKAHGSGMVHVTKPVFESHQVPVPPLNEQRRIVAKLEKLLSRVDAAQARLATIPRILKRFRQSVLAAACSGRLTADWRGDDKNETTDDLPSGWQRTEVENLLPRNGIFDGPFGSNLKTSDYTPSGVRVIRLENIGQLKFNEEKETYISQEKYETLIRHTVQEGDIIFASFIADEVRACVLPHIKTKAIAKADCFCLRPKEDLVDRTFLTYQLISQETFNSFIDNIHGATRPRINTTQLRRLTVRVCPLPEQQEIVRRVEALFKTADAIEARYRTAKAHVDKLTQSILARAFRGELVTTEAELARLEGRDYEPASVLLERIRHERTQQQESAKSSPKRTPRGKRDTATKKMFA